MSMRVGVLLNPIAGFGGAHALHGTDYLPASRFAEAVKEAHAERRLIRALERFRAVGGVADFVAAPGAMGSAPLAAAGIRTESVPGADAPARTTRTDTLEAAALLVAAGVEVILFAGGDGTATDLAEAVGTGVPVIGVPSGVKMHSQVFARSPEGAGRLLADVVAGRAVMELADVLDVDLQGATGVVTALLVPTASEPLQGAKAVSRVDSAAAGRAIARELVAADAPSSTWIIGPGTTAGAVAAALGFPATLRGVDVRHPSGSVEADVTEARLYDIVLAAEQLHLVLGVVGGQGFLLGRGNQQISRRIIEEVGPDRIEIVATSEKVDALFPPILLVDPDVDPVLEPAASPHPLIGYRRVRTGARQSTVLKVVAA